MRGERAARAMDQSTGPAMMRQWTGTRIGVQGFEEEIAKVISQIDLLPRSYPQGISAAALVKDGTLHEGTLVFDRADVDLATALQFLHRPGAEKHTTRLIVMR